MTPQAEDINYDIVILEQSPNFRFNRGALLNAGVLLTSSLDHDYYIFNDVDTVPAEGSSVHYRYPEGDRPLHVTPPGLHPKYADNTVRCPASLMLQHLTYGLWHWHAQQSLTRAALQEFFGGIAAFSRAHIMAVNGHGTAFWGWGKEGTLPSLMRPVSEASHRIHTYHKFTCE